MSGSAGNRNLGGIMIKSGKCSTLSAAFVLAFASVAISADTGAQAIEKSGQPIQARDHRAASATAIRVAATQSQAGETANACAALSQSLESYRKALAQETGDTEAAASNLYDESDGMAEVRARFGCKR
jgi:predicted negative regulator of RcsB-dependent stress response